MRDVPYLAILPKSKNIMKIIHLVLGKANPNRMNGVNKVVYQLATEQHLAGKEVEVWGITSNTAHDYGDRVFSTSLFPAMKNPFSLQETLKECLLECDKNTIFHLHGGWIPTFYAVGKLLSKHHIPFVLTAHGAYNTVAMHRNKWKKFVYFHLFEKKLLQLAQKIHCIGASEVEGLQKIFPNDKTFLLPYGFEYNKNTEVLPNTNNISFIIGFVGRLDIHTKGLDILLDSFVKFLPENPKAKLWIVGDGEQKQELQKIIREKNIENSVIFWGAKFGEEKANILRKMHVFAHPSRNEGLPASVLEACSCGIPCIVSPETNVGEYIEAYKAGIKISQNTPEMLAYAFQNMEKMRKENTFPEIQQNATKMVKEVFNWQTLVHKFDELYF
jgi:glycosyltransferase involved in cell wall biosynthesis